jgi:hypothetical protein
MRLLQSKVETKTAPATKTTPPQNPCDTQRHLQALLCHPAVKQTTFHCMPGTARFSCVENLLCQVESFAVKQSMRVVNLMENCFRPIGVSSGTTLLNAVVVLRSAL